MSPEDDDSAGDARGGSDGETGQAPGIAKSQLLQHARGPEDDDKGTVETLDSFDKLQRQSASVQHFIFTSRTFSVPREQRSEDKSMVRFDGVGLLVPASGRGQRHCLCRWTARCSTQDFQKQK